MGIAYNTSIVRDGLALHLDAANVKSYPGTGTAWTDLSGNGRTATLFNSPSYDTSNGGNLTFDGVNDYATVGQINELQGNNPWSLEMWVNVNSSETGTGRKGWLFWEGPNTQTSNQLISASVTGGALEVAHWTTDTTYANATINFGQWSCFTVTFDGTTEYVYKNSVQVGSRNITLSVTLGDIYLGSRVGMEYLNVKYGNFKIYTRALSASEVKQNFEAHRGRYGV